MFIVGLFSWWYGRGWLDQAMAAKDRLLGLYDYFSIDMLVRTLFMPFRQISAGGVRGSLSVQLQAWVDQMVSRIIGMMVRTVMIVIGSVSLLLACVVNIVMLVLWPFVPLLPVVGGVLSMTGWIPWKI